MVKTLRAYDIIETDEETGKVRKKKVYATSKAEVLEYILKNKNKKYDEVTPESFTAKRVYKKMLSEKK